MLPSLLDIVEWFSCDSTTHMRYGHEIVMFWQIGYRLFHGKFLRFMSGIRNFGQVREGTSERGFFDPLKSEANCAVPNGLYVWKPYYKHRSRFLFGEFEFTSSTRDASKKDPSTGSASSSSIYGFLWHFCLKKGKDRL